MFFPLNLLFTIPDQNKRPKPNWFLSNFVYRSYTPHSVEAYIFVKTYVLCLIANAFLVSALAYSFVTKSDIAVGFISFRFDAARPLDGIARQFPHNVFPVLIILALAYSTCLFLLHSDYLSASRWRDPTRSKYHYGDKMPPLPTWHYLAIVFFGSICLFYLHGLPELLRTYSGIKRLYSEPQLQAFFLVALLYVGLFQTLIVPISYSFINVVRDVLGRFA